MIRRGISLAVRLPGLQSLVVTRQTFHVPCTDDTLAEMLDEVGVPETSSIVYYQSEWQSERFSALVYVSGVLRGFLQVRRQSDQYPYPQNQVSAFRFPAVESEALVDGWVARLLEPLPAQHRPYQWNAGVLPEIASQATEALSGDLPRPSGIPSHWLPIHGDLTPWNLRVDRRGRLWLIDWELARYGPPLADLLRFVVTELTIVDGDPRRIAAQALGRLGNADNIREAAEFWLSHPIFAFTRQPEISLENDPGLVRGFREVQALRILASRV